MICGRVELNLCVATAWKCGGAAPIGLRFDGGRNTESVTFVFSRANFINDSDAAPYTDMFRSPGAHNSLGIFPLSFTPKHDITFFVSGGTGSSIPRRLVVAAAQAHAQLLEEGVMTGTQADAGTAAGSPRDGASPAPMAQRLLLCNLAIYRVAQLLTIPSFCGFHVHSKGLALCDSIPSKTKKLRFDLPDVSFFVVLGDSKPLDRQAPTHSPRLNKKAPFRSPRRYFPRWFWRSDASRQVGR
jgi:hypothetical protein